MIIILVVAPSILAKPFPFLPLDYPPLDAQLDGETLYGVYFFHKPLNFNSRQEKIAGFVAKFEWVGEWEFVERISENLLSPHTINMTKEGNLLISETGRDRVFIIDTDGFIVWDSEDYGIEIWSPNDAEISEDGKRILVCENMDSKITEIELESGEVVWQYDLTPNEEIHDVDYLDNGNISFVKSLSKVYTEINRDGEEVWSHGNEEWGWVRNAERGESGNTLIADYHKIYLVTPDHRETVLTHDMIALYNIHKTPEGLLTVSGNALIMLGKEGIKWVLTLPQIEKEELPLQFNEWRELSVLGYVQ